MLLHEKLEVGPPSTQCRVCGLTTQLVLDLGAMPSANALVESRGSISSEYPLVLEACVCGNLQLRDCLSAEDLYRHYLYATPQSVSLADHYGSLVAKLRDLGFISSSTRALEVGSNVGAFLEFLKPVVASVLGVDPARNIADMANAKGIPTIPEFFNEETAEAIVADKGRFDLVIARHCMAHNRDPYEILRGVVDVMTDDGVFVMENAYAVNTILGGEFDQVYHEHMFFFTLHAIVNILSRVGLSVTAVLFSQIHGGSIACLAKKRANTAADVVSALEQERARLTSSALRGFALRAETTRRKLQEVVSGLLSDEKKIYAYGATAKSATLINYCGFSANEIPYCADSTQIKQGRFFPKSGIEVVSEEWAYQHPPHAFLLTAWNYRDEIIAKARRAGARSSFVVPIPSVEIFD